MTKSVTYRIARPIEMFNRNGGDTAHGVIDEVEFPTLPDGQTCPDTNLAASCAKSMVDLDGKPADPADLAKLDLSAGLRQAFLAQLVAIS